MIVRLGNKRDLPNAVGVDVVRGEMSQIVGSMRVYATSATAAEWHETGLGPALEAVVDVVKGKVGGGKKNHEATLPTTVRTTIPFTTSNAPSDHSYHRTQFLKNTFVDKMYRSQHSSINWKPTPSHLGTTILTSASHIHISNAMAGPKAKTSSSPKSKTIYRIVETQARQNDFI